ncbi:hypothetical protein Dsin_011081 [Dipteronia sinensis]|uniref:Glycosyltransferase n=1 Tax=Dipteronia sinensis TaxID=43782 RepID=A0AAE0ATM3_9ROSI|nr:hypothetical protein Dsin_011081 [Dipteronia sinensis]
MQITKPHAALLASPGMGHLIPVLELGNRLVNHHNLHVTVFVVAAADITAEKISQLLDSSPNDHLDVMLLPSIDISCIVGPDTNMVTKIAVAMHESLPALRSAISGMKIRPTALIVDLFGTGAMSIADEFEMLKYVFIASNAWFLATTIYAPFVDKKVLDDEHVDQKKPLKIPGCSSVRFEDTLETFLDPNDPMYHGYLSVGREISTADGILVNTWEDLEPKSLRALRDGKLLGGVAKAAVYPIGPLARTVGPVSEYRVLEWLDIQPNESVIYVSFGSGGTLSSKQMIELAWGLELSQQKFIWVVRPPLENDVSGSFFTVGNGSMGTVDYLPDGFLNRTHNVGMVVPMWAPQAQILEHPSIGAFLSHCGWNSTLESITNGVPMIVWPLYAEQKMNATMVTEELGVSVRSKGLPTERIVDRQEIEMMVRKVMLDKERHGIKNKVMELKNSALKASSMGGSSYNSLSQLAQDCENRLQFLKVKAQGA